MARLTAIPERNWVNIQWLARLRWAEIAGQAGTVLVGQFLLDGALPMAQLLAVIAGRCAIGSGAAYQALPGFAHCGGRSTVLRPLSSTTCW